MMNILMSINNRFVEPARVMLYSLCKNHSEEKIDIYLLHHGLSQESVDELKKVLSLFKDKTLCLLDVGGEFVEKLQGKGEWSVETWYRIIGIELLPKDLKRILWLDADILVKGNIDDLYNTDIDGKAFAVCEDYVSVINRNYWVKDNCGVPQTEKYFNAGVLLMNLEYLWKYHWPSVLRDVVLEEFSKYPNLDQDILNRLFYGQVKYMPWSLYNMNPSYLCLDLEEIAKGNIRYATYQEVNEHAEGYDEKFIDVTKQVKDKACIIHYIAESKPWNYRDKEMYWVFALYRDYWFDYEKELNELLQ